MDKVYKWIEELKKQYNDDKYYYDEKEAIKFYKFISKLELDKGKKGTKIKLLKFQFDISTKILCVKRREDNLRRYREAHINLPRKNGKSFLVAIIMTYLYYCKIEFGSELIIAANTSNQASLLFNMIHHMVKTNKTLKSNVKITDSRKYMYREAMNSYLRVISSDASNADSYAGFICVLDEIHESPNRKLYDKLKTSMGIWDEPLLMTITTASSGKDKTNLEYELYNYAKDIESGEIEDDSFFYTIFEADKNCDVLDEEQWHKSNPALGKFRKYDDLKSLALRAKKIKTQESAFRRLYLNQHVALEGESAINITLWNDCIQKVDLKKLIGKTCWCGLDMSSTQDITAFVQVFYDEDTNKYIVYPHLFTPKNTLLDRVERDGIRYDIFNKQGYIHTLEGNFINFEQLNGYIRDLNIKYDIEEIGFDRWGAIGIVSALEEDFTVFPMGQGVRTMSPIIKDFENLLIDNRLVIAENPMLTLMAENVVAVEDAAGNLKYDKRKSKNKIDGIIAMLMGLGRAIENNTNPKVDTSKYLTEDYLNKLYGK